MIYDLEKAQKLLEQLFVLGEGSGDSSLLLEAHHSGWATELHRGNAPAVERHVKRGLDIYDATMHADHIKLYGHDPGACALGCRGLNHWLLGYPDQARKSVFKGLALAEGHEHPFSIAELKWFVVVVLSLRGESQAALNRLEELKRYSQEYEYPLINKLASTLYGVIKIHLEQDLEGAIQLREAFSQVLAMKGFMLRAWFLSLYLDICILTGAVESGLVAIEREMVDHPITGERLFEAEVRRLWGELLLVKEDGEVREAETQFKMAMDISRRQGARSLELRATMSLAELWRRQGKLREAHQKLKTIFDWFAEGLDTADLRAARQLVTELE
jgi:hypothetical protein